MREAAEMIPHQVMGLGHDPLEQRRHFMVRSTLGWFGEAGYCCRATLPDRGEGNFHRDVTLYHTVTSKTFAIAMKWHTLYDSNFWGNQNSRAVKITVVKIAVVRL